MFDKLIESNSEASEFKPRRKFFMVSSVIVGILFVTAVVASLYAQDIDLGTDNFELAELLAPIAQDAPEPEPPRPEPEQRNEQQRSELPSRQDLIARIDQLQQPPTSISTTPNRHLPIPDGRFTLNPSAPETNGAASSEPSGTGGGSGSTTATESSAAEVVKAPEPPPIPKVEPKKPITRSKGVVNGDAISLPKPAYPAAARPMNLTTTVNVQVLIDESGDVVSAKAIDGNVLFRAEAERAARRAKFKPTLLSDQPIKVTGVIVYRFIK